MPAESEAVEQGDTAFAPEGELPDVFDDAERDDVVPHVRYEIASYGWDPDVEGLVRRLRRDEIVIPDFQRQYVWKQPAASRFIESLLLGLPVPGVFLATDSANKQLVIDGQQRLKTLQFFCDGFFNPKPGEVRRRVFNLIKVQERFEGLTYSTLEELDRRRLDNSIIPATIVKQQSPSEDNTSIFHIFERLNSGGQKLASQEIRAAIYHGSFAGALNALNSHHSWRKIFGKPSDRLKDIELILRFLALYHEEDTYSRPMSEFLNKFSARFQNPAQHFLEGSSHIFRTTVDAIHNSIGPSAFRPARSLNAAVFDAIMVGLARRFTSPRTPPKPSGIKAAYDSILANVTFSEKTARSTADALFLHSRLEIATEAFAKI